MKSNYRRIGDFIERVNTRNKEGLYSELLGININKYFMPSVANVVGTDLTKYKVVEHQMFACNRMHVGRDMRLPIAVSKSTDPFLVSPAYDVFEITKPDQLLHDYLMMWFTRAEFDRNTWFFTDTDVRGKLGWDSFCDMTLPVPSLEKQQEIVDDYHTVQERIRINEELNNALEETAQTLYKHWFDTDENQDKVFIDDLIEFNPKHTIPKGLMAPYIEMSDVIENKLSVSGYRMRSFKSGSKFCNNDILFARITPCLENGKTAIVSGLPQNSLGFGSTEFIIMRPKKPANFYWVYCLARDEKFRNYAISSMVGSSGRQRVHSDYLKEFKVSSKVFDVMDEFENTIKPVINSVIQNSEMNNKLEEVKKLLLSKMATVMDEKEFAN
ncbi:restriction endonuclease subunit S [Nonlabens antarcticus]|uniref:restriction endonuclease subunit S n=1 Tax=Nonlabens antarcticus TaxID=392714 RepID=UPI0018913833|nr:restriction endonuclease subunit S [Nonlabens antarcticus]